jgi:hypothetical protein
MEQQHRVKEMKLNSVHALAMFMPGHSMHHHPKRKGKSEFNILRQ